jgi:hypothetical protein
MTISGEERDGDERILTKEMEDYTYLFGAEARKVYYMSKDQYGHHS